MKDFAIAAGSITVGVVVGMVIYSMVEKHLLTPAAPLAAK